MQYTRIWYGAGPEGGGDVPVVPGRDDERVGHDVYRDAVHPEVAVPGPQSPEPRPRRCDDPGRAVVSVSPDK